MCSIIIFKGPNILKQLEVPQQSVPGKITIKNPTIVTRSGIPNRLEGNESPDFWMSDKKHEEPADPAVFQVFLYCGVFEGPRMR